MSSLQKASTTGNLNETKSQDKLVTATEFLKEIEVATSTEETTKQPTTIATTTNTSSKATSITPVTHIITTSQGICVSARCANKANESSSASCSSVAGKKMSGNPAAKAAILTKTIFSPPPPPQLKSSMATNANTKAQDDLVVAAAEAAAALASPVIPSSKAAYEKLILQQSTPLKNQIETSQKHSFKAKKFGNLFKLQSIRSAKVTKKAYRFIFSMAYLNKF